MNTAATKTASITFDLDDYNAWQQGTKPSLILDPEGDDGKPHIYTFASIGNNGWPMSVHNRVHRSLASYNQAVSAESLQEWLETREDELLAIAETWKGSEWDGSNHVGRWSDDADERRLCDDLDDDLQAAIDSGEIASYWDASDFYGETKDEVLEVVLQLGSIEKAAEQEVDAAGDAGHLLDQDDVKSCFRAILEDARDYRLDEDDEDDAQQIAAIEKVLAGNDIITEHTTRDEIINHLNAAGIDWEAGPLTVAGVYDPRSAITVDSLLVYFDCEDPSCKGWAWRYRDSSGALDSFEELDKLVSEAV